MKIGLTTPPPPTTGAAPSAVPFKTGDAIRAEVVSVEGRNLTLKTADGVEFTARSAAELPVRPGDMLPLTVTGRSGNTVLVELERDGAAAQLKQLNLPVTPQNVRAMAALMGSSLEPTARNMKQVLSALESHPTLSPEQAVYLIENKVPLNAQNVALFLQLERQELKLGSQLLDLAALLTGDDALPAPGAQTPPNAGVSVLDLPAGNVTEAAAMPPAVAEEPTTATPVPGQPAPTAPETAQPGVPGGAPSVPAETAGQANAAPGQPPAAPAAPGTPVPPTVPEGQNAGATPNVNAAAPDQAAANPATGEALAGQAPGTSGAPGTPSAPATPGTPSAPATPGQVPGQAAPTTTPPAGQTPGVPAQTNTPVAAPAPGVTAVPVGPTEAGVSGAQQVMGNAEAAAAAQSAVPGAPGENSALSQLRRQVGMLFTEIRRESAGELPRALSAERQLQNLQETLAAVSREAETLPAAAREAVLSTVKDIAQTLGMTRQLSQVSAFVQLPVMLHDKPTTADLYVFADDKKKKIDPQNASMFLSLTTAHMERVEVFVKVIGKNLETDFSLNTDEAARFFQGHGIELSQLLEAQGYRLTRASFARQKEVQGPVEVRQAMSKFTKRYRFDQQI